MTTDQIECGSVWKRRDDNLDTLPVAVVGISNANKSSGVPYGKVLIANEHTVVAQSVVFTTSLQNHLLSYTQHYLSGQSNDPHEKYVLYVEAHRLFKALPLNTFLEQFDQVPK